MLNLITICYDSDSAGIEAAFRAGNMLQEADCQVRVAMMPDGMDPDEYIKKYGEEKFRNEVIGASFTLMVLNFFIFVEEKIFKMKEIDFNISKKYLKKL